MDFDWWRRDGFDWLNTGRDYLGMFFLAEVLMCLRGIPNKWSQHRPEFRFSGCSLDMTRELERVLRDSDEGITKLRCRRSAEETQLAKARVADRRKVAAENGDDPKSA